MRFIFSFLLFSSLYVVPATALVEFPQEENQYSSVYSNPMVKVRMKIEDSNHADFRERVLPPVIGIQRLESDLTPSIFSVQKYPDGRNCTVSGWVEFSGAAPLTPYNAILIAVPEGSTFGFSIQPYGNQDSLSEPIIVTYPQKQGATLFRKYDIPVCVPARGPACLEVTLRMDRSNHPVSATGTWFE